MANFVSRFAIGELVEIVAKYEHLVKAPCSSCGHDAGKYTLRKYAVRFVITSISFDAMSAPSYSGDEIGGINQISMYGASAPLDKTGGVFSKSESLVFPVGGTGLPTWQDLNP